MEILNDIANFPVHAILAYAVTGGVFALLCCGAAVILVVFGCYVWGIIDDSSAAMVHKDLRERLGKVTYRRSWESKSKAERHGWKLAKEDSLCSYHNYYLVPQSDEQYLMGYFPHILVSAYVLWILPILFFHLLTPTIVLAIAVGLVFLARLARRTSKMLNKHVADKEAHK